MKKRKFLRRTLAFILSMSVAGTAVPAGCFAASGELSGGYDGEPEISEPDYASVSESVPDDFENAQVTVRAETEFDDRGALSCTEMYENTFLLTYGSAEEAYRACMSLGADSSVVFAEPNRIRKAADYDDDDITEIKSWGNSSVGTDRFCEALLELTDNLPEIKVAVLDTGIYAEHSMFKGRIADGGKSFSLEDDDDIPDDRDGHGTHCAGIVCASTNSNVKILPVQVLSDTGEGSDIEIYCGMMYAAAQGADIISMSLGGYGRSHLLEEAVETITSKGIVICAAAGNEHLDTELSGENLLYGKKCVAVASVNSEYDVSRFSNFGCIDFAAPGENILSAGISGPFSRVTNTGTSMAAPMVAACFADIMSWKPELPADEIYDILKENAVDICDEGYDSRSGWGVVSLRNLIAPSDEEPDNPGPEDDNPDYPCDQSGVVIRDGELVAYNGDENVLNLKQLVKDGVIPDFSRVGDNAFSRNYTIEEITFPDSVKEIGDKAFYHCMSLRKIAAHAETIGESAFESCGALSTLRDEYLTSIGKMAFQDCSSLVNINAEKLDEIPESAFNGCSSLKSSSFDFSRIRKYGDMCFSGCSLEGKLDVSAAEYFGENVFKGCSAEEIVFPDTLEELPAGILADCYNMKKISAPSVRKIGAQSLALGRSFLSEDDMVECDIDFSSVTEVGKYAFSGYVFSGPVSFDSIGKTANPASFAGCYGESLSLPSVVSFTEETDFSQYEGEYFFNTVYVENAVNISALKEGKFRVLVPGDRTNTGVLSDGFSGIIASRTENSEIRKKAEENGIEYGVLPLIFGSEDDILCHEGEEYCLNLCSAGEGVSAAWYRYSPESGEEIQIPGSGLCPVSVDTDNCGTWIYILRQTAEDGTVLNEKKIKVTVNDIDYELKTGEITEVNFDSYSCGGDIINIVLKFVPETDGEYVFDFGIDQYFWTDFDEYPDYNYVETYGEEIGQSGFHAVKAELEAGKEYRLNCKKYNRDSEPEKFRYVPEQFVCVQNMNERRIFIGRNNMINGQEIQTEINTDGYCGQENFRPSVTVKQAEKILAKGKDYTVEYPEPVVRGYNEILITGIGNYYGTAAYSIVCDEPAEPEKPFILESTNLFEKKFTPEKSGLYNIVFKPSVSDIISTGEYMSITGIMNIYSGIFAEDGMYPDCTSPTGFNGEPDSCFITAGLSEETEYRIKACREEYNSKCIGARECEVIITQGNTLADCSIDYRAHYDENEIPVNPEIHITGAEGEILTEGKDYTVELFRNDKPGIMFAYVNSSGRYPGAYLLPVTAGDDNARAVLKDGQVSVHTDTDRKFEAHYMTDYIFSLESDTGIGISSDKENKILHMELTSADEEYGRVYRLYPGKKLFLNKGSYRARIYGQYSDEYLYDYAPLYVTVNTGLITPVSDAAVTVKETEHTGKALTPEITVEYSGEILAEGTDYEVLVTPETGPGIYTGKIKGIGRFGGETEFSWRINPPSGFVAETLKEGLNTTEISSPGSSMIYSWIPEKSIYFIHDDCFSEVNITILGSDDKIVYSIDADCRGVYEADVTPGEKYTVYVRTRGVNSFGLYFDTEGYLAACGVTAPESYVQTQTGTTPSVVFTDGEYTLSEGTDYVMVNDGWDGLTGRHEYVFRGKGKYFGDVTVPVISYFEKFPEDALPVNAALSQYNRAGEKNYGDNVYFWEFTSEDEGPVRYHAELLGSDDRPASEYAVLAAYDENGTFIGLNKDAADFTLEKGQKIFFTVSGARFIGDDDARDNEAFPSLVITKSGTSPVSPFSVGDVNGDGVVNTVDFAALRNRIVSPDEPAEKENADLNHDGTITSADLILFASLLCG